MATTDEGPAWPDVALEVDLGGQPQRWTVVIDRQAYVLVEPGRQGEIWFDSWPDITGVLLRVDLDTGAVRELAQWPSAVDALATDGERLFASVDEIGIVALTLDGDEVWRYPWPKRLPTDEMRPNSAVCAAAIVVEDGDVTFGCDLATLAHDAETVGQACYLQWCWTGEIFTLIARLNAANGDELWRWTSEVTTQAEHMAGTPLPDAGAGFHPAFLGATPVGLSVGGGAVVAMLYERTGSLTTRNTLLVLDDATGSVRWTQESQTTVWNLGLESISSARPIVTDTLTFVRFQGEVQARNLGTGERVWGEENTARDTDPTAWGITDLGLAGSALYVPSDQFIRRYDLRPAEGVLEWITSMDTTAGEFFDEGPLAAGGQVYLGSWNGEAPLYPYEKRIGTQERHSNATVWAFDAEDGGLLWRHREPGDDVRDFAVSDGLLVYTKLWEGSLVALGQTAASPQPVAKASSLYPAANEAVTFDLSDSGPGLHGPPTRFMADWGDGTQTPWQDDPVLTHAYASQGERTARFVVGNEGGQSASVVHTIDVGGTPPTAVAPDPAAGSVEDADGSTARAAGPVWSLLAVVLLVAVGGAALVGRRSPAPAQRLDIYRAALIGTVSDGDPGDSSALSALRSRLGVTNKQHARLLAEAQEAEPASALLPGRLFLGRYRIAERLGVGGTGEVWKATDEDLDRPVAIKRLSGDARRSAIALDRLREETRMAAQVQHAHIVAVHDLESVGDEAYLVMEFMAGGSLADRLQGSGPLPEEEAVQALRDVLAALAVLHDQGIIHRDVKPANVLFTGDGTAKLSDFTVARQAVSGETMAGPSSDSMVGTLAYMAPEQARGQGAFERSDLYAAGATLYEALTGRPVVSVEGLAPRGAIQAVLDGRPDLPLTNVSQATNQVLMRSLAKDPGARFRDAAAMDAALRGLRAPGTRPRPRRKA